MDWGINSESNMRRLTVTLEQWNSTKDDAGMTPIPIWIRVTSSSMMPWIRPFRDDVMVVSLRPADLKVGDIVLFTGNFRNKFYCLHRVHKIEGDCVRTFGDGNLMPDDWMSYTCIMGKAVIIKREWFTIYCESPYWRLLFYLWKCLLPIRLLFLQPLRTMHNLFYRILHRSNSQ